MGRIFWTFVLVLGLSFSLSVAAPQGKGKGVSKGKSTTQKKPKTGDQAAQGRAIGRDQERTIRNWFSNNLDGLPPGLAKREQLPPGLQGQLQKNGTLPPGLREHIHPLPEALKQSLPKLLPGVRRGIIGDDLILVAEGSEEVLDIVRNVSSTVAQVF